MYRVSATRRRGSARPGQPITSLAKPYPRAGGFHRTITNVANSCMQSPVWPK